MTTLKSYWVMMTYLEGETRWYWADAYMESSMLNALYRAIGNRLPAREKIREENEKLWTYKEECPVRKREVQYEVHRSDDMPTLVNEERTTIYDNRDKDLFFASKEKPSGRKEIPLLIKL